MTKKTTILPYADVPSPGTEVDLSYMFKDDKQLRSIKVDHNGQELWLAKHHTKGQYWTSNPKDPKILNTCHNPPRGRGNVLFMSGEANKDGRPKGASNRITAKAACDKMNANPAEFLAAVMTGNIGELKRYRIKNPADITVAQRMKAAEVLINKLVPNLKPVDTDADGNLLGSIGETVNDSASQIQVYLPGVPGTVAVAATPEEVQEVTAAGAESFMEDHATEVSPAENEDDAYVWRVDPEESK